MPSRPTVMAIGRAPRLIVHAACARPDETVLGTAMHSNRRKCSRCPEMIPAGVKGVVVQGRAARHHK